MRGHSINIYPHGVENMKQPKGFIFTIDALIGIAAILALIALAAIAYPAQSPREEKNWYHAQILFKTHQQFLTNPTAVTHAVPSVDNYFCQNYVRWTPTAYTPIRFCQATP